MNYFKSYWAFLIQAVTRRKDFIENAESNFQGQWILSAMRMSYNVVNYYSKLYYYYIQEKKKLVNP